MLIPFLKVGSGYSGRKSRKQCASSLKFVWNLIKSSKPIQFVHNGSNAMSFGRGAKNSARLHSGGVPRRTQKGRTRERPVASFIPIHWSRTVALTNADRWLFILHCFPVSSRFWSLCPIQISYRRLHYPEMVCFNEKWPRECAFNLRPNACSDRIAPKRSSIENSMNYRMVYIFKFQ
jgi:hypothetical protein